MEAVMEIKGINCKKCGHKFYVRPGDPEPDEYDWICTNCDCDNKPE